MARNIFTNQSSNQQKLPGLGYQVLSGAIGDYRGLFEADGGQLHQEKVISTAFIFLKILGGLMDNLIRNNNFNFSLSL